MRGSNRKNFAACLVSFKGLFLELAIFTSGFDMQADKDLQTCEVSKARLGMLVEYRFFDFEKPIHQWSPVRGIAIRVGKGTFRRDILVRFCIFCTSFV